MAYVKVELYYHGPSTTVEEVVQICRIEHSTIMHLPSPWYPSVISGRRWVMSTARDLDQLIARDPDQLMWRGSWNRWERYERGDTVAWRGATFVARGDNVNAEPTVAVYSWMEVGGVGSR